MRSEGPHMKMVKLTTDPGVPHRAPHMQASGSNIDANGTEYVFRNKQSHKGSSQLDMSSEGPHMKMVKLTTNPSVPNRALHMQVRRGMRQSVGNVHSPHSRRVKT